MSNIEYLYQPPPPKVPPHNEEVEQALLAGILINNEAYHRVSDILKGEHFYQPVHGRIFDACASLINSGRVANPVTLKSQFDQDDALIEIGGAKYLVRLIENVITVGNAPNYARIIYDCWLRRSMVEVCEEASSAAHEFTPDRDADAIAEQLEERLFTLASAHQAGAGPQRVETGLTAALAHAERAYKAGGKILGLSTGFPDLDRKLGGLIAPDLIVLGGRPSMGKTELAANIAFNVARSGTGVGVFSLEMSADQLGQRLLARISRISADRQRRGEILERDFEMLVDAAREIGELPLWIDDSPALGVSRIRNRARRLARKHKIGLIVIDHLQLMRQGNKQENRRLEIGEITSGLKALAKDLGVPILLLSQLSRALESRDDKRPIMSDLRESGDIEQDADVILFLYRAEYYLGREQPRRKPGETQEAFTAREADWQAELAKVASQAEIIVAKQRMGAIGTVRLYFDPMRSMFESAVHEGRYS